MDKKNLNTLKNQVYDDLFSDIINGAYPTNTILTEKLLMEKYNVSRAPIREALTQLIGNHILTSIPRKGYKILEPTDSQLLEIVKFRSAIECYFLQNYHIYINKSKIDELRSTCIDYNSYSEDNFIEHWKNNSQFHLKLFSIYGNKYTYKLLEDAVNFQTIYFVQKKHYATMDLHLALLDYLEKGDIGTAVTLLKADIQNLMGLSIAPLKND